MNAGTDKTSPAKQGEAEKRKPGRPTNAEIAARQAKTQQAIDPDQVDDTRETLSTFLAKVDQAKLEGLEWVETTPEIIRYYNRKGLNGAKFFIFQGIKVCEQGQSEAIDEEMNTPLSEKLHGKGEARVVSGG